MPLGLAGVYALGPDVAPPEHRTAWAEQIDRVSADYRVGAIYAACNSEKGAGGSLAATRTAAERGPDGRFQITGEKILASFGRHADMFFSTAKVQPAELPGCGVVEFFLVRTGAPGVRVLEDWDGFGMRSTESHTVRYTKAPAEDVMGFPNFIETVQPVTYWFCLFAAIPLGCAAAIRRELATPAPESPALRLRFAEALMREEALRAYLHETARAWRPAAGPAYAARVLRAKTYVTQEATKLCAELFALGGGRHYTRSGRLTRALAGSFAGTALRPPLPLALDTLVQQFAPGEA
jgi:alkylation response protein AidB-like acyl-CoA dehydrogenase